MFYLSAAGILKIVPITVNDQSARTSGTYDSTQVTDIYVNTATTNYWDISYLGNNIFSLVSVVD